MNQSACENRLLDRKPVFSVRLAEEIERARNKHRDMQSIHEGLAVIWEEFEELKAEVFKQKVEPDKLADELISVAAMCQRMYEDVL